MHGVAETIDETIDVEIIDVAPRDGLQNDAVILPTATKVELVQRLIAAGLTRIEVTSFVNPARVPAMADADQVMRDLPRADGVSYIGLVLNERGLERAVAAGVDEVNVGTVASDTFAQRNQGVDARESIDAWRRIDRAAADSGIPASVVISVAFGCPFEGEISVDRLVEVTKRVLDETRPARFVLADTIGVATPADVIERVRAVRDVIPEYVQLGCHFHNTRNTGIANAYAAIAEGVTLVESSLGGIGGCPFAPKATGNICTEDLVYMLDRMGVATGLDLAALTAASTWLEEQLGRPLPGAYMKAGPFPRPA